MSDDAYPKITTSMIDVDEADAMLEGVGELFDLRFIDAMCRATGTDTLEHVAKLLAIMHGDDDAEVPE